jgi:predicted nucleic acid-binding protein
MTTSDENKGDADDESGQVSWGYPAGYTPSFITKALKACKTDRQTGKNLSRPSRAFNTFGWHQDISEWHLDRGVTKIVIDANIIMSALISDSMTRQIVVESNDTFVAPAFIHREVERYRELIAKKSGLEPHEVESLMRSLFQHVTIPPRETLLQYLHTAARLTQDIDPDDALYMAAAAVYEGPLWTDDGDLREDQDQIPVMTTEMMVKRFEDHQNGD